MSAIYTVISQGFAERMGPHRSDHTVYRLLGYGPLGLVPPHQSGEIQFPPRSSTPILTPREVTFACPQAVWVAPFDNAQQWFELRD